MQNNKKTTDAQLKATKKYANSKYRPNVYLPKDKQEEIEIHFNEKGCKTFNEYIISLLKNDGIDL